MERMILIVLFIFISLVNSYYEWVYILISNFSSDRIDVFIGFLVSFFIILG